MKSQPLVWFTFICMQCGDHFRHTTPVTVCGRCARDTQNEGIGGVE